MINYISPSEWFPADEVILEANAERAVKTISTCIVSAGPGSGKTELLAQKACYLLQTNSCRYPRNILAISFKTDAANNLAERVEKRCGKDLAKRFCSMTYDKFAKKLVDHFINAIPQEYQPNRDYDIIDGSPNKFLLECIEKTDSKLLKSFYSQGKDHINSIFNLGIYRLEQLEKGKSALPLGNFPSASAFDEIKKIWHIFLKGDDTIKSSLTFPIISLLAEYILRENPRIKKALQCTYSHIFLDEFQDTTFIQYELVKTAFAGSKCILTAVGDTNQRIMLWANADRNVFSRFKKDFSSINYDLTMNYRSLPKLVDIQKEISKMITDKESNVKYSTKHKNPDEGLCEIWHFNDDVSEADYLSNIISSKINEGIDPREICILCKIIPDKYTPLLIKKLADLNIKARLENEYQELLKEDFTKIFIDLLKICFYTSEKGASWQKITELLVRIRDDFFGDDFAMYKNLDKALDKFTKELYIDLNSIATDNDMLTIIDKIISFMGENNLTTYYPNYNNKAYFDKLKDNLAKKICHEYFQLGNWHEAINSFLGYDSIPIMSIHKSKGLEFQIVFLMAFEDQTFFNFKSPDKREEELCAFFVALSRAKRQMIFTYADRRNIGKGMMLHSINSILPVYTVLKKSGVIEYKK